MAKIEQKAVIDWDCDIQDISGTKWVAKDEAEAAIKKANETAGNGWFAAWILAIFLLWSIVYAVSRH